MAICAQRRFFACFVFLCVSFGAIHVKMFVSHELRQRGDSGAGLLLSWRSDLWATTDKRGEAERSLSVGLAQLQQGDVPLERLSLVNENPGDMARPRANASGPFHRHWDTNCSAIFAGVKRVVRRTNLLTRKERLEGNGSIAVPDDGEVRSWTRDCASYRRVRRYPTNPASEEEAGFPVAYIIVAHKEAAQVERLLRATYQPHNLYCIHPDAKSPPDFQLAIRGLVGCFENVFLASKIEDVQYAGYTRLLADINCMKDLMGPRGAIYRWKYVMNLCGQDFPLKTNLEIVRQLKAYRGHNDITGVIPPPPMRDRTRYHHVVKEKRLARTGRKKTPPPHNLTIHFGNAYYAATRSFVRFVLTSPRAVELLEWSNNTFSPDEHYWATLQRAPGTPGGFPEPTWDENVRFMKWGDIKRHPPCHGVYVRGLCVFDVAYLEYLATQPHLFANKFYYSFDPVALQCLEEALDHRTLNPSESDRLPNFPVMDLVWQNHTALL